MSGQPQNIASTPPLVEFPPTAAERWELRYHVPRSQVWEGSRGRQRGHHHLHVRVIQPQRPGVTLTAISGRRNTISRGPGIALCGRNGWYEVADDAHADDCEVCPRCLALADRYGVEVPDHHSEPRSNTAPPTAENQERGAT